MQIVGFFMHRLISFRMILPGHLRMSRDMRKPVFGVSDQVPHKADYTATETLKALSFGFKKKRNHTIHVAKTKTRISCAVTAQLIYAFGFAYAKIKFSHDKAHIQTEHLVAS